MYQSYPAAGPETQSPPTQPPPALRNAVRLMYLGAVLEVIQLVAALATISSLKAAILRVDPSYTAAQLHNAEVASTVSVVVGVVITIGLWLWMAWANGRGRRWARIVSAVFFGINTLDLAVSFARVHATATVIVAVLIWLVGLAAIVLLFRRESSSYYQQRTSPV
ncbi:MAG TPA: hypothetical protein VGD91_06890 [Trebonia sp.]